MAMAEEEHSVEVRGLQFSYPNQPPFLTNFSVQLKPGTRCLLVGANGSGKTTLLRILAGKHLVGGTDVVRVLGSSAFHDTSLICSGQVAYLGESWSKTVGSCGELPLQGDFSAEDMIFGVQGVDPSRREVLIDLLDIDLEWRMHKVSDGQRRRVQICVGLLQPFKVLLLDEITVDLDVVARMDLLEFFIAECKERCATIVYATHIFDGLETWGTHVAHVEDGKLKGLHPMADILKSNPLGKSQTLLEVVESWLRKEREEQLLKTNASLTTPAQPRVTSPWASSRHMAYYR